MRIRLSDVPLARADAELFTFVVASDDMKALRRVPMAGASVLRELERRRFKAGEGTSLAIAGGGPRRGRGLAVVGLGGANAVGPEAFRRAADQVVARAREARARSAAVAFVGRAALGALRRPESLGAFVEGAILASYAFDEYRRDPERVALGTLLLVELRSPRDPTLGRAVRTAETLARATNQARTWINLPAAVMTPSAFATEAARAGRAAGLEVRVDGPREIAGLGMGALLAVAQGSAEEPRFVRLTYRPRSGRRAGKRAPAPARRPRRLALVGKGITFDSGGLSLKRPEGMEHMKRDMAGGAAVIAAMTAIAALRPAIEVRAYVPVSENMPGGAAVKPGDVLRTASGKTVEVLNTDAEGRLVLADALTLALAEAPDAIVDIATLTGAIRTALGTRVAGVMGNDRTLIQELRDAAEGSGERIWELPLVRAYRPDLDSAVADLRNVAEDGHGGSIHAALFLEEFVGSCRWAHFDIAGVAFTDRDLPATPRGAVGYGVRLLTRWVLRAADAR